MADGKEIQETSEPVSDDGSETSPIAKPKTSSFNVLIQGVALFSDGYNVQIIGYMQSVLAIL